MRAAITGLGLSLMASAAVAGSGPIKLQADRLNVEPGACGSVTYEGSAEMEVAGAEVDGVKQAQLPPGAGTLFRADRIRLIHASGPEGCAKIERIELEGHVSYRTPSREAVGFEALTYYPETDTMSAVGPDGGAVTVTSLQPQPQRPRQPSSPFRF